MWAVKLKRSIVDRIGNSTVTSCIIAGPYDEERVAQMHATRMDIDPRNRNNPRNSYQSVTVEFKVIPCHFDSKNELVDGEA